MNDIYFAKRTSYPGQVEILGPFTNLQSATKCAKDCLYPERSKAFAVPLSTVQEKYTETSSYPKSVLENTPRYFAFTDFKKPISKDFRKYFRVSVADERNSNRITAFQNAKLSERRMVWSLMTFIDKKYDVMYELREKVEGSAMELSKSGSIARLVKTYGFDSRRQLLDLTAKACTIRNDVDHELDFNEELAYKVGSEFWRAFVVGSPTLPVVTLENWCLKYRLPF